MTPLTSDLPPLTLPEQDALDILFPHPRTEQEETYYLWAHHFEPMPPHKLGRWAQYGQRKNGLLSRPAAFGECLRIQAEYLLLSETRPVFGQILWAMAVRYHWLRRFGDWCEPVWERDAMAWARDRVPCPLPRLLQGVTGC